LPARTYRHCEEQAARFWQELSSSILVQVSDLTPTSPGESNLEPSTGDLDLDMLAASLRADEQDLDVLVEVLAEKLTGVLGSRVEVRRQGGRFKKPQRVVGLALDLGDEHLEVERSNRGLTCKKVHVVRGIALRTDELSFPDWVSSLVQLLAMEAKRSEATRAALDQLLT
jgi:hypothetical protein